MHKTNWTELKAGIAKHYDREKFDEEFLCELAEASLMGDVCPVFNRLTGEYMYDGEPDVDTPIALSTGQLIFYLG